MGVKGWIHFFIRGGASASLQARMSKLEKEIGRLKELEKQMEELKQLAVPPVPDPDKKKEPADEPKPEGSTTIIIEHMNVEKVMVGKWDMSSNLGQLGIRELTGRLNIGTVYGEKASSDPDAKAPASPSPPAGPKVTLTKRKG
ncbi:hypothetical protein MJA45_07185 [Paenibacillus aurantius]|uniref:Uncharacterized protein n=1 Tax=Paenibacillus aurantius TaxID=2918900 RepID=A0AA96RGY9_9BACL|nr:hypothetical protein [Paenibacillus aurantius]WNQ12808.1 hypothetical protein MJA45_07185 [Paenibacillus aurantius]